MSDENDSVHGIPRSPSSVPDNGSVPDGAKPDGAKPDGAAPEEDASEALPPDALVPDYVEPYTDPPLDTGSAVEAGNPSTPRRSKSTKDSSPGRSKSGAATGHPSSPRRAARTSSAGDSIGLRTPPQAVEAEAAVLASILLSSGEVTDVFEKLEPADFYSARHRKIYEAARILHASEGRVDPLLLRNQLEQSGDLDDCGGMEFIVELTQAVSSSANLSYYVEQVREKALRRHIIDCCNEIISDAFDPAGEGVKKLDEAQEKLYDLGGQATGPTSMVTLNEAIDMTFDLIDEWQAGNSGIQTGFVDLDEKTNGLQPGDLIVVAGRPSMGKTTLAMNMARHVAVELKKPVAVFSLEVESRQIAMNLLCGEARVEGQAIRSNRLRNRDFQRLTAAATRLMDAPIYIDEGLNLTAMTLKARARRMQRQHNIELIVIDYLQLMELGAGRRSDNRQQEISEISRSLKSLARELKVPVITISQLSRGVEQRDNKRPRMSDLRESGAIEQDADQILLIYRDEYYYPDKEESKGKAEVIVAKNRNGPVGAVELAFIGEHLRFENLAHHYQEDF